MRKLFLNIFYLSFFVFFTITNSFAIAADRPPQYVLLAFDGSHNLPMWKETLNFATNNNVKFSYFISGVYFLLDSNRLDYIEPTKGPGKSAIGFAGNSKNNLVERVNFVNKAFDEGHTIGSHANGHFDGTHWSSSQWELEFRQFTHLIFDVFNQKGFESLSSPNPYHFNPEQIIGFRSPQLATNADLYKTLRKNNYAYDTSQSAPMDYWPRCVDRLWNFPLAELRIYGTGRKTLSMDYNFYYANSGGKPDETNAKKYREEMFNTYMGYFTTNYYGNRAPIHIGHHFAKWNAGAYWQAFEDFTKAVCNLPEVKCVSYQALLNFLNSVPITIREQYQKGDFPKLDIPMPAQEKIAGVAPIDISFQMHQLNKQEITTIITGKHSYLFSKNPTYVWMLNDKEIYRSNNPKLDFDIFVNFIKEDSKLSVVLELEGTNVLKTSQIISVSTSGFKLSGEDLEKRATLGDLPEAHDD
jgi:hypothetical protein